MFSLFSPCLVWLWVCQFCWSFQRNSFCFVNFLYCFSPLLISALYLLLLVSGFLISLMISHLTHDYLEVCLIQDIWSFLKYCYWFLILILLRLEHTLCDLIFGNNIVLWPSILSVLVNVYHTSEKKVYTAVYRCSVVSIYVLIRLRWWIVLFRYSMFSLTFFCLVCLLIDEKCMLKSLTTIVGLLLSSFNSVKFWFIYFQVLLLGAYTCMILFLPDIFLPVLNAPLYPW